MQPMIEAATGTGAAGSPASLDPVDEWVLARSLVGWETPVRLGQAKVSRWFDHLPSLRRCKQPIDRLAISGRR
jgi:hypothetical protein